MTPQRRPRHRHLHTPRSLADDHDRGFAFSDDRGFMFSDDHGASASKPNRVTKAFLRHRRNVGLREFRLHDLRHFMATQMLHAGI